MALIENLYTGDGSTVLFSFTFPYINAADVKVSINGADTTAYTLANATTVEFTTAPGSGDGIRIYRSTGSEEVSATFFPGSTIRAQDLNDNFEQTLFVVQETVNLVNNSDANSVLTIANNALSTAQQAESTAAAAQAASQNAIDTAISAGDNVSDLTNDAGYITDAGVTQIVAGDNVTITPVSGLGVVTINATDTAGILEAPIDGNQYARQDGVWSVVTGGGGEGSTTITQEYSGAAAWGRVESDSTVVGSLNVASVVKEATGQYRVTFATAMPNANYAVTLGPATPSSGSTFSVQAISQTTGSFLVRTYNPNNGTNADRAFAFAVHALNALPPTGGTGADTWADTDPSGNLNASFNIANVNNSSAGVFEYTFTTPMPTADYAVVASVSESGTSGNSAYARVDQKTTTGFRVQTWFLSGSSTANYTSYAHSVVVHASNAQLPETITMAMWNDLVARVTALENP